MDFLCLFCLEWILFQVKVGDKSKVMHWQKIIFFIIILPATEASFNELYTSKIIFLVYSLDTCL
jgi:hypothetical protein